MSQTGTDQLFSSLVLLVTVQDNYSGDPYHGDIVKYKMYARCILIGITELYSAYNNEVLSTRMAETLRIVELYPAGREYL